jgi:polypeptide N-acetylgalactosaminyltransferase
MKNDGTHNCLDTMGRKSGEEVGLSYCHGLGGNQVRYFYAPASSLF